MGLKDQYEFGRPRQFHGYASRFTMRGLDLCVFSFCFPNSDTPCDMNVLTKFGGIPKLESIVLAGSLDKYNNLNLRMEIQRGTVNISRSTVCPGATGVASNRRISASEAGDEYSAPESPGQQ